jgi:hypothetical protein
MREVLSQNSFPDEHHYALEKKRLETIGDYSYRRFASRECELLDAEEEIGAYIDSWDQWDKSNIEALYEDIESEPLPVNLSAYIIVPVAAGQETERLKTTLAQYARQDADPSTWALMLYVNHVDPSENISPDDLQRTDDIIDEFKANHPDLSVRVIKNTYCDDAPPIGAIRATAWDVALLDVQNNNLAYNDLMGITHDADAGWISSNYISEMQQAAVENPEADIFTGRLGWQKQGKYSSDINKLLRYWEYLDRVQYHQNGRLDYIAGANEGIRVSAYAALGGFGEYVVKGEVQEITERLGFARRIPYKSTDHIKHIDSIMLKTDARRQYQAMALGISPDLSWESFPFLTGVDVVRSADNEALANTPLSPLQINSMLITMDRLHLWDVESAERLRKVGRRVIGLPQTSLSLHL